MQAARRRSVLYLLPSAQSEVKEMGMARSNEVLPSRKETRTSDKWIDGRWVRVTETFTVETADEFLRRMGTYEDEYFTQTAKKYTALMHL